MIFILYVSIVDEFAFVSGQEFFDILVGDFLSSLLMICDEFLKHSN